MKQIIIGVSGGSGSGKTHFCEQFLETAHKEDVAFIRADRYFKKELPKMISPLSNEEYDDWNDPESLDYNKMWTDFTDAIQSGKPIVLVEGAYIFSYPELRDKLDLKIFIDTDIELRLYRRIKRNMEIFKFKMDDIATYFIESAKFKEQIYSTPTKIYADIIFNGAKDFAVAVQFLRSYLEGVLDERIEK